MAKTITVRREGDEAKVTQTARGYEITVTVHLRTKDVVEVCVRAEAGGVSPRDVRRLPLASVIEQSLQAAAIARADELTTEELRIARSRLMEASRRVAMPKGRPVGGRSAKWYLDLLATYRELEAQGLRPVPVIAKRKGVAPNLVHQWIHRARKLEEGKDGEG